MSVEYPDKVREYQVWALHEGLCHQCVHPTCKGICSCGGCNNEKYIDRINEAQKWMRDAEEKAFREHIEAIKNKRS